MAAFPPAGLAGGGPPGLMGPGQPPTPPGPSPAPPPAAMLAAARPAPPTQGSMAGGGMSQNILLFLAGLGFHNFAKAMKDLRPDKGGGDKKSPAGSLMNSMSGSKAMPQSVISPSGPPMPPMLQGGMQPGFMGLLAQLAAAANRGNQ